MTNLYFILLIGNYGGGGSWFTFSFFRKGGILCVMLILDY